MGIKEINDDAPYIYKHPLDEEDMLFVKTHGDAAIHCYVVQRMKMLAPQVIALYKEKIKERICIDNLLITNVTKTDSRCLTKEESMILPPDRMNCFIFMIRMLITNDTLTFFLNADFFFLNKYSTLQEALFHASENL